MSNNLLILYSTFQLNIYQRDNLQLIQTIFRSNRDTSIMNINLTEDKYLVLTFLSKVEVYILNNAAYSFELVDTIISQNAQLLMN